MSLTIRLKNIGILKQAEFSLGDLTVICGENNTGKTYAACVLFGFLESWPKFISLLIDNAQTQQTRTETVKIDLAQATDDMLIEACRKYTEQLDKIFAAAEGTFQNSVFHLVRDDISSGSLPKPFISSAERTGVATFRKELSFARDRLLKEMSQVGKNIDPRELLFKAYQNYPEPVQYDIDFMHQLENVAKRKSFIAKEHPEVLDDFTNIVGGTYTITSNDQLYYIPKGTRSKLTMVESSSSARALLDLSFYLSCIAEKGDLLMIDEPELSLHPKNQRRIARLFARLVNLGVKVFITTHSDYIVKELNTLIMLNHDKPHLKRVAEENGYQDSELINVDQVKVYIAEKALMPLEEGQKRRRKGHTLVPAKIHPELGIGVSSFDKTIDDMNRIQDDIVWGEE